MLFSFYNMFWFVIYHSDLRFTRHKQNSQLLLFISEEELVNTYLHNLKEKRGKFGTTLCFNHSACSCLLWKSLPWHCASLFQLTIKIRLSGVYFKCNTNILINCMLLRWECFLLGNLLFPVIHNTESCILSQVHFSCEI